MRLGLTQGARFNDVDAYVAALGDDLPVVAIDGRMGTRSSRLRALRRLIRTERPDVVLSMRVFDTYEAVALEKQQNGGAPRLAVGIRSFEAPYLDDLARYRDHVDLCVTSGELIARLACEHAKVPAERVVSIGGGVHEAMVPRIERAPGQPIRLLYAGRLENGQKRVLDLVPFVAELDRRQVRYELHVAGDGPAEAELRRCLVARVDAGLVKFHGWVTRADLYEHLYPCSDCFVHFAAWEGMTIAPREAMAHGVVPVISRFHGQCMERQFVEEETALTFPVAEPESAAACVARLAADQVLWARLSGQARRSQSGRYSYQGSMDAWSDAFDACLRRDSVRGGIPKVPDRTSGRLQRLGVGQDLQDRLRDLLGWQAKHQSPGSEWPTNSGLLSEDNRRQLSLLADALEAQAMKDVAHVR